MAEEKEQKEIKTLPRLIKGNTKYKLIVEASLEDKIRFMCNQLPHNEWSGTLFYSVEGSFADNNLVIHARDFYLQDVGTQTFTSFQHKDNIMSYMVDNDLIDCYAGLIHSHNTMATMPSGQDMYTIQDEGNDTNHFVSLIVNNAGSYHACITRKICEVFDGTHSLEYHTFENKEIKSSGKAINTSTAKIEWFPLDIEINGKSFEELAKRLEELKNSPTSYINSQGKIPSTTNNERTNINVKPLSKPKEPTLFDNEEYNPFNEDTRVHVPEDVTNDLIKQLISGSIFSTLNKKLNIDLWVENMNAVYDKRFTSMDDFCQYADLIVDFLLDELSTNTNILKRFEKSIDEYGIKVVKASIIDTVLDALGDFKQNKYLDYYIESLRGYMEDYIYDQCACTKRPHRGILTR